VKAVPSPPAVHFRQNLRLHQQASGKRPGGYYQDDGPGDNPPANIDAIPDAGAAR